MDIENGILFEYSWHNKSIKSWKFNYKLTLVVPCNNNQDLILGLNTGIARFNTDTENLEWLLDLEKGKAGNRCNDGGCDSCGRLWIGTMSKNFDEGCGSLYCIDNNLQVTRKLDKVSISNGIAWSPDNTRMYYIDTPSRIVQSFLFNEESGEIVFEKNAIIIPKESGSPDGMTIDEEGMLWIAHWGGYGVYRWSPHNGKLIDKIEVPVPNVSSCAFAGDDLDHLIITTAREGLSEGDLLKYSGSGDIFFAKMKAKGVKQNRCGILV